MYKSVVYSICFVLLLAALTSVTNAQVENLALNPSFEEDEDAILMDNEWFQWCTWAPDDVTGSNVYIVDTESIDGGRSLRVEPVGVENWHLVVANISFPMENGTDFTASFWAKAEEPRPLGAQFKAADNSVSWGYADFELTTEWAEYTMTSTAQSDEGKLEFFCAASEVPHWLDFVYVYKGQYVPGIEPKGLAKEKATKPQPADGSLITDIWANLSWEPGIHAVSHDVYFGDNSELVNAADQSTFQGNQGANFTVVGFPGFPYPQGLVPGTTYYWRIDEVNEAEPNSPWTGDVWSLSVPPKTAYLPQPADGAESVNINPELTWTAGYGAKLHTVYFGDSFEDVDNASGGKNQGTLTYNPGTLKMAKTYYWRVDEFDIVETHKGNVWSFTTEGAVTAIDPTNGAVDVTQTPVLTWAPGFGTSHELYFGTDSSSLELKASGSLGSESYETGQLEWNTTYYWRVNESDSTNADSPWTGPLWSFTTANFLILDDFESYNDLDTSDAASNRIYITWVDGFDNPSINGSIVGYSDPPFAEQTIVHSGNQSMPLFYDNAVGKSEATLTLTSNRDWTIRGINTLTIWFRGNPTNAAENMYVALNGSAVVNHDNPDVAQTPSWTQWNIDLSSFADQGVNLANVNSITLGLRSVAGGSGLVLFDDIRLYAN